ncbi:MAG: DUF2007 domain-containing protein [Chromatiaceae bacterium]|nr:DUF2007 domain-containing protein [Gammaproteobacteria bacterium]MCP5428158.1 DUF2007 domain-containing protein [Chromatiaceae bacterium]MCP5447066.1 DUF2007 domain-containing protein [Chromatiaceae bacterium]
MRALYQSKDRVEAQLLKDFLASYHIQTVVHGEFLNGAAGELPVQPFPVLWVLEERDFDRAKALIVHFLMQESAGIDWHCCRCGEHNEGQFHQCWNCGTLHD